MSNTFKIEARTESARLVYDVPATDFLGACLMVYRGQADEYIEEIEINHSQIWDLREVLDSE